MYSVFSKKIPVSIYSPTGMITADAVASAAAKSADYFAAENNHEYDCIESALAEFADKRSTALVLPHKMRGYAELEVTLWYLLGEENDYVCDEPVSVGYIEAVAVFDKNVYNARN